MTSPRHTPLRCLAALTLALASHVHADVPVEADAQRVDGLAAVVGGVTAGPRTVVLLRSDVELRARLGLAREGGLGPALGALPEPLLAASLRELLGEALIAVEATRLSLAAPTSEAVAEERARLIGTGDAGRDSAELLRALGVGDRELTRWAERRAVVRGFLQANLEGTLDVREGELERLFQSDPGPFAGRALDEVRTRYAAWLTQQRLQQAVERWVQSLTQRTPHRVLVGYRDRAPEVSAP
ncbi:MAG: hypothetical protein ABW252_05235 [Polyangiales bacterium]